MEINDFLGHTPVFFDGKDRFNVPARIKSVLDRKYSANLIICGKKNHVRIFPYQVWEESKATWEKPVPVGKDEESIMNRRKATSKAEPYEMKSGKILITAEQRKKVGLTDKEAVLVGMVDFFEIWTKEGFESWFNED